MEKTKLTPDELNVLLQYRNNKERLNKILNKLSDQIVFKLYQIYVSEEIGDKEITLKNFKDSKKEAIELLCNAYLFNQYFSNRDPLEPIKNIIAEEFLNILEKEN